MTDQQEPTAHRQPWLHELCVCVDGNATALSCASGDMRPGTAEGFYVDDVRALSCLQVSVSGEAPSAVSHGARGNLATAGGCLASQYLAAWVIARLAGAQAAREALHYVAPVGEKEAYVANAMSRIEPYLVRRQRAVATE